MKCMYCGYDIPNEIKFCGNCGRKIELSSSLNTFAKYINIGHPIGYDTDENGRIIYVIDNGLRNVSLPQATAIDWNHLSINKEINNTSITELYEVGCILNLNSAEEKEKFLNCRPYRQGFAAVYEDKHAIFLGSSPFLITDTMLKVWRTSTGHKSIRDISAELYITTDETIEAVLELAKYDILYIKY